MKVLETIRRPNGDVFELKMTGSWYNITKTHQLGVSLMNEHGGYNSTNNGTEKYIRGLWKKLKR